MASTKGVKPNTRDDSFRVYRMEKQMYKEGRLKNKYRPQVMSKEEFRTRLMEDLGIGK